MGNYEVERIVAKRVQGGRAEYFIQWQSYSPSENTWEPAEHLPEELITAFENRSVDPFRADECRERLALLFEKGLKSPLACNETITIRHDVVRALFPGLPSDLRGSPHLASEEELIAAGLGPYLKRCLTVTGGGCRVDAPVSLKMRPQNSSPPGRESSDQVYEELFRRTHPVIQMLLLRKRLL